MPNEEADNIIEETNYDLLDEDEDFDDSGDATGEEDNDSGSGTDDETEELDDDSEDDDLEDDEQEESKPADTRKPDDKRNETKAFSTRLKQETDKIRAEIQAETQKQVDAVYASLYQGRPNPYTQKPITSKADYDLYQQMYQDETERAAAYDSKDPVKIQAYEDKKLTNSPVFKQMQDFMKQQEVINRMNEQLQALQPEIDEIAKIDPSIKSIEDLRKHPKYNEIVEKNKKGLSVSEAFFVVNKDAILQRQTNAARQKTLNNERSKEHLNPTGMSAGTSGRLPPKDEYDMYRRLNPKMTREEIIKDYNSKLKQDERNKKG